MILDWLRGLFGKREPSELDKLFSMHRRLAEDTIESRSTSIAPSERQRIASAIISIGQEPPDTDLLNGFCIQALRIVTSELIRRLGQTPENASEEMVIACCMFIIVGGQVLSRDTGASFEQLWTFAPLNVFHKRKDGEKLADCVEHAQTMLAKDRSRGGKVQTALIGNFAIWLNEPTEERISKLASLVGLIATHIE